MPYAQWLKHSTPRRTPLPLPEVTCEKCGTIDRPRLTPGKGPHAAGMRCKDCGAWEGWLPKRYAPAPRQTPPASAPDPAPSAQDWARHQARQRELAVRLDTLLQEGA